MRRARRAALALVVLATLFDAGGCATVLDLSEREDAVARLCACDAEIPPLSGDCRDVLSERLSTVTPATRGAWLSYFAEHCGGDDAVCSNAYDCYAQRGTCSPFECSTARECCGFSEGRQCMAGQCVD